VRRFAFSVVHSSTILLPLWRQTCVDLGLQDRLIPRDVATRWNSTYDMLKVAVEYRVVFDTIVSDKKTKMRKYELDDIEWEALSDLLVVLKTLTLKFSREGVATLAHVIPAMDQIDGMLKGQRKKKMNAAVRHALRRAKAIMNKYYSKSDQSYAYRIAMGKTVYLGFGAFNCWYSTSSRPQAKVLREAGLAPGLDR
ncbi:hypothetical protein B0H15DRAFT_788958, partial [Mycena belliarum]